MKSSTILWYSSIQNKLNVIKSSQIVALQSNSCIVIKCQIAAVFYSAVAVDYYHYFLCSSSWIMSVFYRAVVVEY